MNNYYKDRLGNRYVSDHAGLHNCKNTKFKLMGVTEDDEETGKWNIVEGLVGDDNSLVGDDKSCSAGCDPDSFFTNKPTEGGLWGACEDHNASNAHWCDATCRGSCSVCCKLIPTPPPPPPAPTPPPTPLPACSSLTSSINCCARAKGCITTCKENKFSTGGPSGEQPTPHPGPDTGSKYCTWSNGNCIDLSENSCTRPKYPYPAIVGYWGTQAGGYSTDTECQSTYSIENAVNNGCNVIILTFAQIGGQCTEDKTKCQDFGGIIFPSNTLFASDKAPTINYYIQAFKAAFSTLKKNNTIVLLSLGGANAQVYQQITGVQIGNSLVALEEKLGYPISGIDWDLENGADSTSNMIWAAGVSQTLHNNGYIVTAAPQSSNLAPFSKKLQSGAWNTYVTLIHLFPDIDAVGVQWYEPTTTGHPHDNVDDIVLFIKNYMNPTWIVTDVHSKKYPIGKYFEKYPHKLLVGVGAGTGWNGANNYNPSNLVSAYSKANFGGFMIWDVEIDSGAPGKTCLGSGINASDPPWKYVKGLSAIK